MEKPIIEKIQEVRTSLRDLLKIGKNSINEAVQGIIEINIIRLNSIIDTMAMIEDVLHSTKTSRDFVRQYLKEKNNDI